MSSKLWESNTSRLEVTEDFNKSQKIQQQIKLGDRLPSNLNLLRPLKSCGDLYPAPSY